MLSGSPSSPDGYFDVDQGWQPNSLHCGPQLASQIWKTRPDLVWLNLGVSVFGRSPLANLSGFTAPWLIGRAGIPTVVTLHELVELADLRALNAPGGPIAGLGARLLTRVGLQADVVCLTMRHYVDWLGRQKPGQACVQIPIGAYQTPEMLPPASPGKLLFFTTLAPFKGLEVLLEAFKQLQAEYPALQLTIAGTEHPRFPGYARQLRAIYDGVPGLHWVGKVPEEQVRGLFQQASVVVLPYQASTGSSSILYQAAAWGRSIVASDLPEIRVSAQENGLAVSFFECGNPASLANALRKQLASETLRQDQAMHNLAAMQQMRPEDTCHAYLRAFDLALSIRSSSKRIQALAEER